MPKNQTAPESPAGPDVLYSDMTVDTYALIQIVAAVATTRSTTARETVNFAKQVVDELKSRGLL